MKAPFIAVADPVFAYDRVAASYSAISKARSAYLDAVDQLVIDNLPAGSRSLLDVGAGDGRRAVKIATASGIADLVLLEPSREMQKHWPDSVTAWTMRAEEVQERGRRFDVITCLWNVLGHITTAAKRKAALTRLGRLLSPQGAMYVDVNHRYNARAYGAGKTVVRYLRDRIEPGTTNGDVVVRWTLPDGECTTSGHVFTDSEMRTLLQGSGLKIERRFVVDYATGQLCRRSFEGNLLYALRADSNGIPQAEHA